MQEMVNVYFFGKKYSVPADLTIMTAMEYAGYTLIRGCGCRHGFCGACATIYRIKGTERTEDMSCLSDTGSGRYVCSKHSILPDRQENLRHRRDQTDRADHDGTVSGNLQLYRM